MKIGNPLIKPTGSVNYLGIHLDRNLPFQQKVKNISHKMASGIKTIYCLRGFLQQKENHLVLNSPVISHLHYSPYWYIAESSDNNGKSVKLGSKSLLSSKHWNQHVILESDTKLCLSATFWITKLFITYGNGSLSFYLPFRVTLSAKVPSREKVFYLRPYHTLYKIRKDQLEIRRTN